MGEIVPIRAPTGLCGDTADVARQLRALADDIEQGCWGEVNTVLSIIEYDNGSIGKWTLATKPTDKARAVGILTFGIDLYMSGG